MTTGQLIVLLEAALLVGAAFGYWLGRFNIRYEEAYKDEM